MAIFIAEKEKVENLKEIWEKAISRTIGGDWEGHYPLVPISMQPQILEALYILHSLAYDLQLPIAELQGNTKKLHIDKLSYFQWESAGGDVFNFRYVIKEVGKFYLNEIPEDFFFPAILKIISNFAR